MSDIAAGGLALVEGSADRPAATPQSPGSLSALHTVIPAILFQSSLPRALGALGLTLLLTAASLALAIYAWQQSSWVWMPISWWASGFTLTSLFVVAHDCGHLAFLRSRRANFWLGHTLMLPTLYPFHAWRFSHNSHHGRTNCLDDDNETIYSDNAWLPLSAARLREKARHQPAFVALYVLCRVLIPVGSAVHALVMHYWPFWYRPGHRPQVMFSIGVQLLFCAALGTAIVGLTGSVWALLHFWLIPWMMFQCWMAVYTFLHHTADDIPLFGPDTWNAVNGQLHGTVNCRFPRWISYGHHAIDVHIPHHIAVNIPCYHLRAASAALAASPYGSHVREFPFTWRYLFRQIHRCVFYDADTRLYQGLSDVPTVIRRGQHAPPDGATEPPGIAESKA